MMTNYIEDEERRAISWRCIKAVQPYRNSKTEFILNNNGHYEGDYWNYCDKFLEREADSSPGRSHNLSVKIAEGDVFVFMCNDVLVQDDWLEECRDIVLKHPKYLATPFYPLKRKWHELEAVDGYCVNERVGSNIMVMTRKQFEDIGQHPEENPMADGSDYINRWVTKGYAVMMTKTRKAIDLAEHIHSYTKQQAVMGYTYKNRPV